MQYVHERAPVIFRQKLDGMSRCTRYAFGPNRLHMCGPDQSPEVLAYLQEGASDKGLQSLLQGFATMYPYLREIAHANHIRDPFDDRVIEAYWIGNELLDTISTRVFYKHLTENIALKKRSTGKAFEYIVDKLRCGAKMHHSFHVFNVWQRTGHTGTQHTLYSMDQCRVSWGDVVGVSGPIITVKRQPLIIQGGQLALGEPENISIIRELEQSSLMDYVQAGDIISLHWGMPCEVLGAQQLAQLKKYTLQSLALANQTL